MLKSIFFKKEFHDVYKYTYILNWFVYKKKKGNLYLNTGDGSIVYGLIVILALCDEEVCGSHCIGNTLSRTAGLCAIESTQETHKVGT